MKIVIALSVLHEHDAISEHALWQAKILSEAGYQVNVVAGYVEEVLQDKFSSGIFIVSSPKRYDLLNHLLKADVVCLHFGIYSEFFRVFNILDQRKLILWDHNITPPIIEDLESERLFEMSVRQRSQFGNARLIVCNSVFTSKEWQFRNQVISMPVPLRVEFVNAVKKVEQERINPSEKVKFICVGRLTSSKGWDQLALLLRRISDTFNECLEIILVVPSLANEPSCLEEAKSLSGKYSNISLHQGISNSELVEKYLESQYSISLSLHEGLGMGQVESMACAVVPIVWRGAGATGEVVMPNMGILLDKADAETFFKVIVKIMSNSEQRSKRLTSEGWREHDEIRETGNHWVKKYLPSYQEEFLLNLIGA